MSYPGWEGVILDTHIYQVFDNNVCQLSGWVADADIFDNLHSWSVGPRNNTSKAFATAYPTYNPLASGQSSVNGPLPEPIVRNISTGAVSGVGTTEPSLVPAE